MPASMECVSSGGWASAGVYGFSLARSPAADGYQRRCSSSTPSPKYFKSSFRGQNYSEIALTSGAQFDLELLPTEAAVFVGVDIIQKRHVQILGNSYNKSEGFLSNNPMRVSSGSDLAVCTESWLAPASAALLRQSSCESASMQSISSQLDENLQSQLSHEMQQEEQVPRSERSPTLQHACVQPLSIPGAEVPMSTSEVDLTYSVAVSQGRSQLRRVPRVYRDMNLMCEQRAIQHLRAIADDSKVVCDYGTKKSISKVGTRD